MPDPPAKGDGSLIRATITRYESRFRVQPPTQVTSQSSKREPIVTGVQRWRNLVSSRIVRTVMGQHIDHSGERPSQVENRRRCSTYNDPECSSRTPPIQPWKLQTARMSVSRWSTVPSAAAVWPNSSANWYATSAATI